MKVQRFANILSAGAIIGTVTALLLLIGVHTGAQVAQVNSLVSVCVNQSTGAMRMLLGSAAPSPASCSAGEQFTQWNLQGPRGSQGIQGEQGLKGDKGDNSAKGDPGKDGGDGDKGDPGKDGPRGLRGPHGTPGLQGSLRLSAFRGSQSNGGATANKVQAPFQVVNAEGNVIFEVHENLGGGVLQILTNSGEGVFQAGTASPNDNGQLLLFSSSGNSELQLKVGADGSGALEYDHLGKKSAELANSTNGNMGLRIWNATTHNVVTDLEEKPDGTGGLAIADSQGNVKASISVNKGGLGVIYGLSTSVPMP